MDRIDHAYAAIRAVVMLSNQLDYEAEQLRLLSDRNEKQYAEIDELRDLVDAQQTEINKLNQEIHQHHSASIAKRVDLTSQITDKTVLLRG